MKKTIVILGLILICTRAYALDINPFLGPKPIAVLVQTDPWLMVIGSDTPRVALYDDGLSIFLKEDKNKRQVFFHKRLSAAELISIKKKISTFGDYSASSIVKCNTWESRKESAILSGHVKTLCSPYRS